MFESNRWRFCLAYEIRSGRRFYRGDPSEYFRISIYWPNVNYWFHYGQNNEMTLYRLKVCDTLSNGICYVLDFAYH